MLYPPTTQSTLPLKKKKGWPKVNTAHTSMSSMDLLSIHYCPLRETNAHGNIKRKNATWCISTLEKVHSLYSLIKHKILNTSIVSALQILILQILSNDTVTVHR